MTVSKADLLRKRFGVEDFEIEGVGTVKIRPLSRAEALELTGRELPAAEAERKLIATALVEPRLTEDEVAEWQRNSPAGELEPLTRAIALLSGLDVNATKEAVKRFRS